MSRSMVPLSRPQGIPGWFVRVAHWRDVGRCNRVGHVGPGVCAHCGQILDTRLAVAAGVVFR